jgi:predicted nucleic acid-binding protein
MKQYLLDASSLIFLIRKADAHTTIECLHESVVLDLTFYEVGNVIWKKGVLKKSITLNDYRAFENMAQTILGKVDRITVEARALEGILEIARNETLSFYDSSYVYFAKENNLILVTEDTELKTKAHKHVKVKTIAELLTH